jgi:hypothetical protein
MKLLRLEPGAEILDLCCGPGRHIDNSRHGKPPPLAARLEKALPFRRGKGNRPCPGRGRSE